MTLRSIFIVVVLGLCAWAPCASAEPAPDPQPEQVPDSPTIDSELEDIAQLFIEKGDFPKALEIYDELRAGNPNNLDVLDMTIELCRKIPKCKGRLLSLLEELAAFVKRNPNSTRAKELLVDYSLEFKDFNRAKKAIQGLVKAKPDSLAHWLLLADHHEEARHFRKLDALLRTLTKRFPKNPEVWHRVADRAMAVSNDKRTRHALSRSRALLKPKDKLLRKRQVALEKEFKRSLRAAKEALYRDFRQDTRWADLEDDFAHSTYP